MQWALLFVAGVLLLWAAVIYNRLVHEHNQVLAAWSDIDVQLKRRHDLIPKLVDAVNAYTGYERATLEELMRLRRESQSLAAPAARAAVEDRLGSRMHHLLAVAEDYPELQSSEQYLSLQHEISEAEQTIQYARRYYNGAVRNLNVRIDSFPDLLIARPLGFRPAEFFALEGSIDQAKSAAIR